MEDEEVNVNLALLCNKTNLAASRIAFTEDEKYVICACGKNVHLYSSRNGNVFRQFSEHKARVTHFTVLKDNKTITSASVDGNILIWTYNDLEVRESYQLGFEIHYIAQRQTRNQYLICHSTKSKSKYEVSLLKLNDENEPNGFSISSLLPSSNNLQMIAADKRGNYVATIHGNKLKIRNVVAGRLFKYNYYKAIYTCVAFHPFDVTVATGDCTGRIVLWQNIAADTRPVMTELHWHANAVGSMCFTSEGTSLISGGEEAVLVLWQLDSLKPDFKPRLGARITDVQSSSRDKQVAIAMENNAIAVVSLSTNELSTTVRKLSRGTYPMLGIHRNPRSNCLVLNSEPAGQLQFYYPDRDKVTELLGVTGQNYISGVGGIRPVCSEVEHLSFNYNGQLLATVQRQKPDFLPEESILKFWVFDKVKKMYHVESIVDPPHKKRITSLEFSSKYINGQSVDLVLSSSLDGVFKLWTRHQNEEDSHTWKCASVCYYGAEPCTFARFSYDSSLIAAAYGEIVTIWETEKHQLRTTLHNPVPREQIKLMEFGKHDSAPYLVTATQHFITVWNLLTCAIWWSAEAYLTCLVADPFSSNFAAFLHTSEGNSTLYMFDPATPESCKVYENIINKTRVKSATFLQRTSNNNDSSGTLYAYTSEQEVYKLCPDGMVSSPEETLMTDGFNKSQCDYEKIFGLKDGQQIKKGSGNDMKQIQSGKTAGILKEMLETPAHVLPPVKTLCEMFLIAMQKRSNDTTKSPKKYAAKTNLDSDIDMDNNDSSDEEVTEHNNENRISDSEAQHTKETVTLSNEKQFLDKYDFSWMS